MTDAKRHHQVPQFYLRQFADEDEQVTVVRFGEPARTFTAAVKNVAVETGFYDVDWLGDERRGELERFLGKVEGAAAQSLQTVLSGKAPTLEDRYNLSAWIALQYVRGRGGRANSIDLQKLFVRAELAVRGEKDFTDRMRGLGADNAEQDWDRVVLRGELADPRTARLQHTRTMLKIARMIAPLYAGAHWRIVRFGRRKLITSDQPVCLWQEPDSNPEPGIGLATADIVSIPLSRDTLLSIMPRVQDQGLSQYPPTTQLFKGAMANTWQHADEMLIHHPGDELPPWLPSRSPALGTLELPDIEQFVEIGEGLRSPRASMGEGLCAEHPVTVP